MMSVALLTAVMEKGVSCKFQHSELERIKRLTAMNSNQPMDGRRQSMVFLYAKKYQ